MAFKVILNGFKKKEAAEAFIDWYLNQGEDEFNRCDTWQEEEDDDVWASENQDMQWDNDTITIKLNS